MLEKDFPRHSETQMGWKKIFQGITKLGYVGKLFSKANRNSNGSEKDFPRQTKTLTGNVI